MTYKTLLLRLLVLPALCALPAQRGLAQEDAPLQPVKTWTVSGDFRGESKVAEDISGIACATDAEGAKRPCLVIDDQGNFAQQATLEDGRLVVGAEVKLFDGAAPAGTSGTPPTSPKCAGGRKKFKDLDGEGVAAPVPGTFYVVGSHGCSRKDDEYRDSSFLLLRLTANGATPKVEATYRLAGLLSELGELKPYFATTLKSDKQGANIEGIAALGDTIFVGLRAPNLDGEALVVSAEADELFAGGPEGVKGKVHPIKIGRTAVGVRDMAAMPDGRILLLTGPTQDDASPLPKDAVPYELHVFSPDKPADEPALRLAALADVAAGSGRAKAEAVTVLAVEEDAIEVLVMFDGLPNGGPREYEVPLK